MAKNNSPDISKQFQKVYEKFFERNGDPKEAIKLIDKFLKKVPHYPEALIFKARMLLALGKNKKAIKAIEQAEKYDKWRLFGKFDKAEAYLEDNKQKQSIREFVEAVSLYQIELKNGIEAFMLSLADRKDTKKLQSEVFEYLSLYWKNTDNPEKIVKDLEKHLKKNKKKIKPLK